MNPKFRPLYLILSAIGLLSLLFYVITNFSNIDPAAVIAIALPNMLFVYMAYSTYPSEPAPSKFKRYKSQEALNE